MGFGNLEIVARTLVLEERQRLKAMQEIGGRSDKQEVAVVAECNSRGVLQSGIFAAKMAEVQVERAKEIVDVAITLRRQHLADVPELNCSEHWANLTDWCVSTIDVVLGSIGQRLERRGFSIKNYPSDSIAAPETEQLKARARNEIDLLKQEFELKTMKESVPAPRQDSADRRKVFVVHGRNDKARKAMFSFLRAIGLHPLEWGEMVALTGSPSPYIGDVLDRGFEEATAVVVLITGDDLARVGTRYMKQSDGLQEKQLTPQARPNVLFEAGMAMGKHPNRTVIVELGETRSFTDMAGRHTVRMTDNIGHRQALADRLKIAGCEVTTDGRTAWHSEGDFDGAIEPPDVNAVVSVDSEPSPQSNPSIGVFQVSVHTAAVSVHYSSRYGEYHPAGFGEDRDPGRAALVRFRADEYQSPVYARLEFYSSDGKTFKSSSGKALTVDKGLWIGEEDGDVTFGNGASLELLLSFQPNWRHSPLDLYVFERSESDIRRLPHAPDATRVKVTLFTKRPILRRREFWYSLGFDENRMIVAEEAGEN